MNDSENNYIAVSCTLHSELELAIMHRSMLSMVWTDENQQQQRQSLLPVDIVTENRQEFLVVHDRNNLSYRIRLDRILEFNTD